MQGIKNAVARVVRVEDEVHEAGRETLRGRELWKQAGVGARPVEVEVLGELFRLLVENVEWTVQVRDEETLAARIITKDTAARKLTIDEVGRRLVTRDRQLKIIGDFERTNRTLRGR